MANRASIAEGRAPHPPLVAVPTEEELEEEEEEEAERAAAMADSAPPPIIRTHEHEHTRVGRTDYK